MNSTEIALGGNQPPNEKERKREARLARSPVNDIRCKVETGIPIIDDNKGVFFERARSHAPYVRDIVGNGYDAEDLMQDFLMVAIRAADKFDPEKSKASTYFYHLCDYHVKGLARKSSIRPSLDFIDESLYKDNEEGEGEGAEEEAYRSYDINTDIIRSMRGLSDDEVDILAIRDHPTLMDAERERINAWHQRAGSVRNKGRYDRDFVCKAIYGKIADVKWYTANRLLGELNRKIPCLLNVT